MDISKKTWIAQWLQEVDKSLQKLIYNKFLQIPPILAPPRFREVKIGKIDFS